MITPRLEQAGVLLRPLVPDDAEALFAAMSDRETQRYRRQAPHQHVSETALYIEDTLSRGHGWAITADGGEALGRIALRVNGDAGEVGVVLRPTAQGRGLGGAALKLVEDYAFRILSLARLTAHIDSENRRSLKLFERAAFVQERIVIGDYVTHMGVRDSITVFKDAT